MAKLENWALVYVPNDPYKAPEQHKQRLHGNVYDHPNHVDGTEITTTSIQRVDVDMETAHTKNTIYELGTVHPEYEKHFPNARERFFKEGPDVLLH